MLEKTNARFIDCKKIKSDQRISLDNEFLEVFFTPGHSEDSITFVANEFLVTGDTLFNGTIGNCFSGDLKGFFNSLKRLISLPEETKIYGGHDYVMESMKMAKLIEKDNPHIKEYIKKYDPGLIVSTLQDELKTNPYIRFNAPAMINNLQKRNLQTDTEYARFKSIMDIY
jgi:hydroxyacylglutathione hydrolase